MSEKENVWVGVELEGDVARRYLFLKKMWGLKTHSSVIRLLISNEYARAHPV